MLPIKAEVNIEPSDMAYVLSQSNSAEQALFFDTFAHYMSKFNYCMQNCEINRSFDELRVSDKRRVIDVLENLVEHLKEKSS